MLQLVFGRSGYGKTEYVFHEIESAVNAGRRDLLLISPEQFSFVAERRLLSMLGEAKINCVENSSFSRLSNEVHRRYGGSSLPLLSKGAKAIMMKKALELVSNDLQLFSGKADNTNLIASLIDIYDELKSCALDSQDMMKAGARVSKDILRKKLSDISLIMNAYEALINDKYLDPATQLSRLYQQLKQRDYFQGRIVLIDGFSGFLADEYKIIELIIRQSERTVITLCTDSYGSDDPYDLFAFVNKTAQNLVSLAKDCSVSVKTTSLTTNYRVSNQELLHCEKELFSRQKHCCEEPVEHIKLFLAKSVSDECAFAAREIRALLRQGFRPREIAVIARDLTVYEKELSFAFEKYEIPYFADERQPIASQPLILFVQYLLRSAAYGYRSDDLISLSKTGLTNLTTEEISRLENYIFLWNINGSKWLKPFENSTKGFASELSASDQAKLHSINCSREYLIEPVAQFKRKCQNAVCRTVCEQIYKTLLAFSADKNLQKTAERLAECSQSVLAEEQGRVWDILMNILDEIERTVGSDKISLKDFYKLFNLIVSTEDLGSIPGGLDNVQMGQADRMRADNPRAVFVLGANEGEFPRAVTSGGLLSESDRRLLAEEDFELYSFGEILNLQERYFAYMACSCASQRLSVSYLGNKGDGAAKSMIVTGLEESFDRLKEFSVSDLDEMDFIESTSSAFQLMAEKFTENTVFSQTLKEYFKEDPRFAAVKALAENDDVRITRTENSVRLFGKDMYLSASRVEDYYTCPFRYFCKFGLGAKPRTRVQLDPMQSGTVIHYVLENIMREIGVQDLNRFTHEKIVSLVVHYLNEYADLEMNLASQTLSGRFHYQYMRLSAMLVSVVERLVQEFMQSEFSASAFEVNIDRDGEVKPLRIDLEDGGTVHLRGAVDRVDLLEKDGEKYIRVVDYKSGDKKFRLSDILYGLNLQMFVYLNAICNDSSSEYNGIPAGVLYMHSARSVYSMDRNFSQKDMEQKDREGFRMKGIVLYDEKHNILSSMEKELKGSYIPVFLKKNGDVAGTFASLADLGNIFRQVDRMVSEMALNLHQGNIQQRPVNGKNHDKTCEYCDYSYVCANRRMIEENELKEYSDTEVKQILSEQ